jgi:hypothetical protein
MLGDVYSAARLRHARSGPVVLGRARLGRLESSGPESSGLESARLELPALESLRLEAGAKKSPATRNQRFTESNLLGEKAA